MKISRTALQTYFNDPLPSTAVIAEAFTFHCFEIEAVEGDELDIKVLPNRAPDCSSESGIAAELSSILNLPLKKDPVDSFSNTVVTVSLDRINAILGSVFSESEVEDVFRRLHLRAERQGDVFRVTAPAYRADIEMPEDIAEEVGRILGYERISATELPPVSSTPDQARYRGIERMKDELVAQGYIEVSTQTFVKKGDIYLAKPLDQTKPALRTSLEENLRDALLRAKQYAPLVLPPKQPVKLFEIGTVFPKEGEYLELRMTERVKEWGDAAGISDNLSVAKLEEYGEGYEPVRYELSQFKSFSVYPFTTRDIALWVPKGTSSEEVQKTIKEKSGNLLARLDQFDHFEKEGRVSYAFRIVFQSDARTLTDEEVNGVMRSVTTELVQKGYEVR